MKKKRVETFRNIRYVQRPTYIYIILYTEKSLRSRSPIILQIPKLGYRDGVKWKGDKIAMDCTQCHGAVE